MPGAAQLLLAELDFPPTAAAAPLRPSRGASPLPAPLGPRSGLGAAAPSELRGRRWRARGGGAPGTSPPPRGSEFKDAERATGG